eukprot:TRINITY_DN16523_c0_g1_i2.p1 TRINITY_DN16523_c0_g1~~TRINITY_DN16523_c0_g1_i2.p1  ORF type:complete len:195 (-),score=8.91 TRINITY_DN16523_c0_g1_i2:602-1186(-)
MELLRKHGDVRQAYPSYIFSHDSVTNIQIREFDDVQGDVKGDVGRIGQKTVLQVVCVRKRDWFTVRNESELGISLSPDKEVKVKSLKPSSSIVRLSAMKEECGMKAKGRLYVFFAGTIGNVGEFEVVGRLFPQNIPAHSSDESGGGVGTKAVHTGRKQMDEIVELIDLANDKLMLRSRGPRVMAGEWKIVSRRY